MDHPRRPRLYPWGPLMMVLFGPGFSHPVGATEPVGFDALRLESLPLLRQARAGQESSFDRTGGNDDKGHYRAREGATVVLADVAGPGCLYRLWSANPGGQLRLFFDGEKTPRVDVPFRELLAGKIEPFAPLCDDSGGGGVCYFPFPFRKRCRVTVENAPPMYYQVTYHTHPPGTEIETFSPEGIKERMALPDFDLDGVRPPQVAREEEGQPRKEDPLPHPFIPPGWKDETQLTPGQTRILFESHRSGLIKAVTLQVRPESLEIRRKLILRMYWEGETQPSVECPLADFFAAGLGPSETMKGRELLVSPGEGSTFTCRFPMPYYRSARLTLTNQAPRSVFVEPELILSSPIPQSPPRGLFHAQYRQAPTVVGKPYVILEAEGRGHYIGTAMTLLGEESLRFLEGDERIFVDGKIEPSLSGTGTEDYFNGGWYFLRGPFATALAGAPVLQEGKSRVSAYRWQVSDCVPFRHHIRVELEHGAMNDTPGCTYHSVAFWYQTEPHTPFPPLPEIQPLPPFQEPGVIEAESLVEDRQQVREDTALPQQASGGQYALFYPPQEGPPPEPQTGAFTLRLPARESGVYDVLARLIRGDQYSNWWVWGWGHRRFDTLSRALTVATLDLGRVRLEAGPQEVTISTETPPRGSHSQGRPTLALDYLQFRPVPRVKGAMEAEDLPIVATSPGVQVDLEDWTTPAGKAPKRWSPRVIGGKRNGPADWSGGAQIRIRAPEDGGRATFAVSVPEDGEYAVTASFTNARDGSQAQLFLDNHPLGAPIDTSLRIQEHRAGAIRAPGGDETTLQVDHRVGLGVAFLKAGSHRLTVEVFPAERAFAGPLTLGLDYLQLKPIPGRYEAEDLVLREATAPVILQDRFGAEPRWRGGTFLRFQAQRVGDRLTLELPLRRSGRYALKLALARLPGGGQGQVFWDGQPVGPAFDGYHPIASPFSVEVGQIQGKAGGHTLTIEVVGRNEQSSGYEVGLDQIELESRAPPSSLRRRVLVVLIGLALGGMGIGTGLWIWWSRRGLHQT